MDGESQGPTPDPEHKRILRDHLAYHRTVMANERSLLAYARTALTMVVTGLASLKLVQADWAWIAGWMMIAISPAVFLYGIRRYFWLRVRYERHMRQMPE